MWFMKPTDDIKFDFSDLEESLKKCIKRNGGRWTIGGKFYVSKKDDGTLKLYVTEMETEYIPLPPYWRG